MLLLRSINVDEKTGAIVLAAQKRFYLASMLIKKGEIERGRTILTNILECFRDWDVPAWQRKCYRVLDAL